MKDELSREEIKKKVMQKFISNFKMRTFLKEENHPRDSVDLDFILDKPYAGDMGFTKRRGKCNP